MRTASAGDSDRQREFEAVTAAGAIFCDVFRYSLSIAGEEMHTRMLRYTLDTYDWPTLLSDLACPALWLAVPSGA
jgi:hypothetical protein